MKLILTAEVSGLGGPGDMVEVKDGYGRNYLLPQGFAILATQGALKQVDSIRRARETRKVRDLDNAKEAKAALDDLGTITVAGKASAGSKKLFGSVTAADVASAIKQPSEDKVVHNVRRTDDWRLRRLYTSTFCLATVWEPISSSLS